MIPTAEEVRRMSIDARGTQRPPAPTTPPEQPAPHYSRHAPRASDVRPCSDLCRERLCSRWW